MKPYSLLIAAIFAAALSPCDSHAAALDVQTAKAAPADVHRFVTLPATIKANQQATLYAKVGGYLASLKVDIGDRVKAGQSLGEIEVPELAAELVKYEAEVRVARIEFDRVSKAQRRAPDLVVPQDVDDARGRMEIAQANLDRTQTLLRYANLTAPFNGIVTMRHVDPGAFIPAATSGSAAASAAVITVADFETVRVNVPVPGVDAGLVMNGQLVRIQLEGSTAVIDAKVSRHSFAIDETTQTLHVEVDVPNPSGALRPGMFATARVSVELHTGVTAIPSGAVVMEKANAFVYLADGGKARKTPVKLGFNDGTRAEITAGLSGGETVILAGKLPLTDGAAINVVEAR